MKKSFYRFTKAASSLVLSSGLIISVLPANTAAATPSEKTQTAALSLQKAYSVASDTTSDTFDTLSRIYDSQEEEKLRYHYEDEAGRSIDLNTTDTSGTISKKSALKKAASLPSSYNLNTVHAVSSIKNQGATGCCWAFAAIKAMESNLAMKGIESIDNLDLSESHLAWYTYHPSTQEEDPLYAEGISYQASLLGNTDEYNEGGNASLAAFTLARWSGAALEEAAPFQGNTDSEISHMINSMENASEALRYRSDYILTDSVCYDNATPAQIKEVLMTEGAIDLSYYHDNAYFNINTNAYYQEHLRGKTAINNANHCVNIIGWDDNYSKENFAPYQPSSDGAWLIANSYGTDFGDNGYTWISYKEPSLTEFYTYCAAPADTFDHNYQYDGYGWGSSVTDKNADTTTGANIYRANVGYNQSLTAVGLYTIVDNQPYTIKIYRGVSAGKPESGTLAATLSGTAEFQGYHTISLANAVSLEAGERFSVVVSYQKNGNNSGYIPVEGAGEKSFDYNITYRSGAGESFLYDSSNTRWIDTSVRTAKGSLRNNVCIKAFTKNTSLADKPVNINPEDSSGDKTDTSKNDTDTNTGDSLDDGKDAADRDTATPATIEFSQKEIILGVGEAFTPTLMLSNAVHLTLSYESSDSSIATVNGRGKITAKAAGTAKIVAMLSSGVSASLTVTVKKAPSSISVTPAKKKTISPKASFRIRVKLPKDSASSKITYSSSKPSVAKVSSNGRVTGKKKGKAVITVTTFNGKTAKLTVRVK